MSNYAYSPSLCGFFPYVLKAEYIAGIGWPADAVDVTDAEFEAYGLNSPPEGMMRGADAEGRPVWVPLPALNPVQIQENNTRERDNRLAQAAVQIAPLQDAVDLDVATIAEVDALRTWKTYRVAVSRVDLTQVSPAWPIPPGA